MVVCFTTTYAISAYHHWFILVRISIRARCTTLSDSVCQLLATGRWFSPGSPVSSTNKTDRHEITEILLKVALRTIKQTNKPFSTIFRLDFGRVMYLVFHFITPFWVHSWWRWSVYYTEIRTVDIMSYTFGECHSLFTFKTPIFC